MKLLKLTLCLYGLITPFTLHAEQSKNLPLAPEQSLKIHYTNDVITLDPQKIETVNDRHLSNQLFEGLVTSTPSGAISPGVATHWEHSADFKTWTFHLRKNAKWTNGEPVTAHDFVYSWQRLADPQTASPYSSYLEFLKLVNANEITKGKKSPKELGIKALDDYTLELTLTDPVPYIDLLTQNPALFPIPQKTVEKYGDKWTAAENLVSNGAYSLEKRVINEKVQIKRNPLYWDNEKSIIENATVLILDNSAAFARYRTGELDVSNVPNNFYLNQDFKKEYKDHLQPSPQLATYRYEINTLKPPVNDVRVRKALNLALDRDLITHKVLGLDRPITYTFTPSYIHLGHKIQQPEYIKLTQEERNQQAKALLKEAGYSKENPLVIELTHSQNQNLKPVIIASKANWEKNLDNIVKINLKGIEWKLLLDQKNQGDFQLITASWFADYNEASTFLGFYQSNYYKNKTGFASPVYDKLLEQSNYAPNDEQRAEYYAQAEAELEKHQPFISLYHHVDLIVKNPKLKGYDSNNPQGIYLIKDLYFEK